MKKEKFHTYEKCISYLFNLERAGIKYDLKNITKLLNELNNPQNNFKSIHVAGTNGKGSVSAVLNSVLIESGFKTGLYTSPHIKDFRERILVDGKFITKKFILNFVNKHYHLIEKIKPSFFEVTTAMAFDYFSFSKTEYAVIEAGLGGRLDSTNILNPVISIITSVSIDHTSFLGNSIQSITKEKGGIIKEGISVIAGNVSEVSKKILVNIAKEKNAALHFSESKNFRITKKTERGFYFKKENSLKKFFYPVIGEYQLHNLKTSFKSLEKLGDIEKIRIDDRVIQKALKNLKINSRLEGRFELISKKPKIVTDISHNLQAISNVKSNLEFFKFRKLIIIFGMMKDKDFAGCAAELGKMKAQIIITRPGYKRAAEPAEILKTIKTNKEKFIVKKNLREAFLFAKKNLNQNDLLLITGSFFLVSDFLALLNKYNKSH